MTVDVAARLAAGRPSVSNTQAYVSACHAAGYQQPDLTAHGAQIAEWYSGEDGLDLAALDADCTALRAAAGAADEALRVARDGHTSVSTAWQGESGSMASDFIDRHCVAGAEVVRALQIVAGACEALRDALGRIVDEKVSSATSIDDRRIAERPIWLAAAATVTSGGAGREEAVEVVTQQITPYVDADIRTEWVTAMRSATASVAAAYEDALRQLSSVPTPYFDVPGQFGMPQAPPDVPTVATASVPAAAMPAAPALSSPAPVSEPAVSSTPTQSIPDNPVAQPLPLTAPTEPPAGLGGATPAGMPAMPDVGGGLSGLVSQIAHALGGLFDDSAPDSTVDDDLPELDEPAGQDDDEDEPDEQIVEPDVKEDEPEEVPPTEDSAVEDAESAVADAEPVEAGPPPPPPEPLAAEQPDPPVADQPDEQTPCEIAADELAQVGQ